MQGRSEDQRDLLDAESVIGHLMKAGSVFAFLAEQRKALFPDEMFGDLFSSGRGRPSVPADVIASVIVLQALHGLSDSETTDALTFDLRWKAAVGWPLTAKAFHDTTLTYLHPDVERLVVLGDRDRCALPQGHRMGRWLSTCARVWSPTRCRWLWSSAATPWPG